MTLPLPPRASCTWRDAPTVDALLDSVIAYRPGAASTYQFYEEIDVWLGPWGASGYPIGYGKKYNILFATNPPLNRDLLYGKKWVEGTTVYLQEAIKNYLVNRVRFGTIATLTEPVLRAAAFDSHPDAYLRAGLLQVAEHSPELFLVILTIPIDEYNPANPNFMATLRQIVQVISKPALVDLIRCAMGAYNRSTLSAIIMRALWEAAGWSLPAGARDDNFADKLGFLGGLINMFDR